MIVVDIAEWSALGARLIELNREKFDELLEAMRAITEGQEALATWPAERPLSVEVGSRE